MKHKKQIQDAIDNWQEKNYICENRLYIYSPLYMWSSFEITSIQCDWIKIKFDLIQINTRYESLSNMLRTVEELNTQDQFALESTIERLKIKDQYFKAILKYRQGK